MNRLLITGAIIASLFTYQQEANAQSSNPKKAKETVSASTEKAKIESLIFSYQDALNAADVNKVVGLYTSNGF